MAAFAATLLFESPFIGLEKLFFGRVSSLDKKPLTGPKEIDSPNKSQQPLESNGYISNKFEEQVENKFEEQHQKQNVKTSNRVSYRQQRFDDITNEV